MNPGIRLPGFSSAQDGLIGGLEALAHETLALIALERFLSRIRVARRHPVLLRRGRGLGFGLGRQALAHELFALVAFQRLLPGFGIAVLHLFLLSQLGW